MIYNIQYLRFLAAALVVFAHSNLEIYGVPSSVTYLGGIGVDIFFIVSGFIMPYIIYGGMKATPSLPVVTAKEFLLRRFSRIWPLYFVITLIVVGISALVAKGFIPSATSTLAYFYNGSRLDLTWILQTLTFTHWGGPPILGIGWTLQFEFIFYFAITVALLFGARKIESIELGLLAFFAAALLANPFWKAADVASNAMMAEFMMGVFLYRVASRDVLLPKLPAILACIFAPVLFLAVEKFGLFGISASIRRPLSWGVPAFILVWAALSLERHTKEIRFLELLGDASYSIYLAHGVVAPIFLFAWERNNLAPSVSPWIFLPALMLACLTAGVLCHLFIEKPLNRLARKLIHQKN